MPFVNSGGVRIHWKLEGCDDSPPLVLLNSIGTDMDPSGEALPALRRRFVLLRIDTRGHGASDAPAGDYRLDQLARDVTAAIADLAMGRFLSPEFVAERPEVAATVRRGLISMAANGYAGCDAAIRDMALADRIGRIDVPSIVVTGTRDTSTPFAGNGEHLLARVTSC